MKQFIFVLITVLALLSSIPRSQAVEADGHLLYDKVDQIYYCIGSPWNCKTSISGGEEDEEEEPEPTVQGSGG
jgi:hypothetical protein